MEANLDFVAGDIIEQGGECYQVLETNGPQGIVRNFPSEEEVGFEISWVENGVSSRKIGHAALPAPSPCSTGGSCPTYEIKPKTGNDANIIARQS
jgi:hypothetical protein